MRFRLITSFELEGFCGYDERRHECSPSFPSQVRDVRKHALTCAQKRDSNHSMPLEVPQDAKLGFLDVRRAREDTRTYHIKRIQLCGCDSLAWMTAQSMARKLGGFLRGRRLCIRRRRERKRRRRRSRKGRVGTRNERSGSARRRRYSSIKSSLLIRKTWRGNTLRGSRD